MNPQPAHFTAILCGVFMAVGIAGSPALRSLLQPAPESIDWQAWERSQQGDDGVEATSPEQADALPTVFVEPESQERVDDELQVRQGEAQPEPPQTDDAQERSVARADSSTAAAEPSVPGGAGVQLAPSGRCGFTANDMEVGRAVRRRQVVGGASPFESNGGPVFAWFDVTNRDRDLDSATVRWSHTESGHTVEERVEIRVGSHWRFYVQQVLPPLLLGNWRIELVDDNDCVVGSAGIEMIPLDWAEEGG